VRLKAGLIGLDDTRNKSEHHVHSEAVWQKSEEKEISN
jgi:hypothetical protein